MKQFDRQYRFSAGKSGNKGFEIGEVFITSSPAVLHIEFNVQKADVSELNTSKISLWGLNPNHLAILNEKDCVVALRAGYGNTMPLIFTGTVSHIETEMDGGDRMTSVEAVDGRVEIRDTYVSLSYKGKINTKEILQEISKAMGITGSYSHNAIFTDFPKGFSFVGAGKNALDKACAPSGLVWTIQNGILQIKRRGDTMTRKVFVIDATSGLIGIPKRVTESAENDSTMPRQGWEVEILLNGAISVGDYVKLDSKIVTGYFKVYSIEHNGVYGDGAWTSKIKLFAM